MERREEEFKQKAETNTGKKKRGGFIYDNIHLPIVIISISTSGLPASPHLVT